MVRFVIEVDDSAAEEIRERAAAAGLAPEVYIARQIAPAGVLEGRLRVIVEADIGRYREAYQRLAE